MRFTTLLVTAASLPLPALAAASTAAPSPTMVRPVPSVPVDSAALAVARQIVAAVHTDQTLDRMMIQFASPFGTSVVNALLADPGSAPSINLLIKNGAGGRPKLEAIFSQEFMIAIRRTYPEIEESAAHEYARRFSANELRTILAFYSSGVGAKVLALMPEIQTTMAARGRELGMAAGKEAGEHGIARAKQEMLGMPTEPKT